MFIMLLIFLNAYLRSFRAEYTDTSKLFQPADLSGGKLLCLTIDFRYLLSAIHQMLLESVKNAWVLMTAINFVILVLYAMNSC